MSGRPVGHNCPRTAPNAKARIGIRREERQLKGGNFKIRQRIKWFPEILAKLDDRFNCNHSAWKRHTYKNGSLSS